MSNEKPILTEKQVEKIFCMSMCGISDFKKKMIESGFMIKEKSKVEIADEAYQRWNTSDYVSDDTMIEDAAIIIENLHDALMELRMEYDKLDL